MRPHLEPTLAMRLAGALTVAFGLLVLAPIALAQSVPGADGPVRGSEFGDGVAPGLSAVYAPEAAEVLTLSELDVAPFEDEDAAKRRTQEWKSWNRAGVLRRTPVIRAPRRLDRSPRAERTAGGGYAWRTEIVSPGAVALRVRARRCELPEGARLIVWNADDPSEAYGPLALDPVDGNCLTPLVFGHRVVVELRVPRETAHRRVRLAFDGVVHAYRDLAPEPAAGPGKKKDPLACIPEVVCDEEYVADVARAVCLLTFVRGGSLFVCTGTLLNDTDPDTFEPFVLTANHCIPNAGTARSVECFWDYRTKKCGGKRPNLRRVPRTREARLERTVASSDMSLIRLEGTLPAGRYFAGWTVQTQPSSTPVVGVHHPAGSHMRISYGVVLFDTSDRHAVLWSEGSTSQGSSGSAIFNADRQVIGQLCCGAASCGNPDELDFYGRLDQVAFPIRGELGSIDAIDFADARDDEPGGAFYLGSPAATPLDSGPRTLATADPADWSAADLDGGESYRFSSPTARDVRVDVFDGPFAEEPFLSAEADPVSGITLDIAPPVSGRYWLRVTSTEGSSTLRYRFTLSLTSAAGALATAPGRPKSKAKPAKAVKMKWKDEASSEMAYLVEILEGSRWMSVAELPAGSKRFTHEPGIGPHLYRVGARNGGGTAWTLIPVLVPPAKGHDFIDPFDDVPTGATDLGRPGIIDVRDRTLHKRDREDWFVIDLVARFQYSVQTSGDSETVGEIFAEADVLGSGLPDGELPAPLASDDRDGDFLILFTPQTTGRYLVRITSGARSKKAAYDLHVRRR